VPAQECTVLCRIAPRCWPVLMRTGGHISFATNDRFYPGSLRFLVKFNRAKQIAVVRDRDGRHLVFSRLFHQLFHPDTAVQQRIFSVQMQMNERIARHCVQYNCAAMTSNIKSAAETLNRQIVESGSM